MKNVIVVRINHNGESRVALRFACDTELISVVKEFPGARLRWSELIGLKHSYAEHFLESGTDLLYIQELP